MTGEGEEVEVVAEEASLSKNVGLVGWKTAPDMTRARFGEDCDCCWEMDE